MILVASDFVSLLRALSIMLPRSTYAKPPAIVLLLPRPMLRLKTLHRSVL